MDFFLDTCGRRRYLLVMQLLLVWKAAADCPIPPEKENMVLSNEALLMNRFPEGSTVSLLCVNGYIRESGSGRMSCIGGNWTEPDLRCKKKDCGPPKPQPHMSFNISEGTLFGAVIRVICDPGFQISGATYRRCYAAGWIGRSQCEVITCQIPANLTDGVTLWFSEAEPLYGDTVDFSCNQGFVLVGNKSITCLEQDRYDAPPPECKGATAEDGITLAPTPAPAAPDPTTTASAHRDKSRSGAASTLRPPAPGDRHTLADREPPAPTSVTPTTRPLRGRDSLDQPVPAINTSKRVDRTPVIISVIFVSIVATIAVFGLHKFLRRRKGSYDTREDLKPELLQFQNL